MPSPITYKEAIQQLDQNTRFYNSVANQPDEILKNLIQEVNKTNKETAEAIQAIKDYQSSGWGWITSFFTSHDVEIQAVNRAQQKAVNKVNKLLSENHVFSFKKQISEEQLKQMEKINSKLNDIDIALNKHNLYQEMGKVDDTVDALKTELERSSILDVMDTSVIINNSKKRGQTISAISAQEEKLERLKNQYDQIEPKIPAEKLDKRMKQLKAQLDAILEPYGNKENIPLPNEIQQSYAQLRLLGLTGKERQVFLNNIMERKATFNKARNNDPFFNFLVNAYEGLSYRMEHKKVGISDQFLRSEMQTKEQENAYHQMVDSLTKDLLGKEFVSSTLKALTSMTWSLLTAAQRNQIVNTLAENFENPEVALTQLQTQLRKYKALRVEANTLAMA